MRGELQNSQNGCTTDAAYVKFEIRKTRMNSQWHWQCRDTSIVPHSVTEEGWE